jgi:fructose-specific phosphotransferase system IIA component
VSIRELISNELVDFHIKSQTKQDVIEVLIEILFKAGKIFDKDEFYKAVLTREEQFSTGIGLGIAIPHGKGKMVKEAAIAFGRTDIGIDFSSIDNVPVRYIFMIAVPEGESAVHLKAISEISRKLMRKELRESLLKCENYNEFIKILGDES